MLPEMPEGDGKADRQDGSERGHFLLGVRFVFRMSRQPQDGLTVKTARIPRFGVKSVKISTTDAAGLRRNTVDVFPILFPFARSETT